MLKSISSRFGWTIVAGISMAGCAAPRVDFSTIQRPERPVQLSAYDVFVGDWIWEATMTNAEGEGQNWTGSASWNWTLDGRALQGTLSAESGDTKFEAMGIWGWHPRERRYFWGMMNNWGYPQQGTAKYNATEKSWQMDFKSVGLDGTTSYGRYRMTVVDANTLNWSLTEWADYMHMFKKMEMSGTYRRKG